MELDYDPLDVLPVVDVLSRILQELQELNQAVRELPREIAAEVFRRE